MINTSTYVTPTVSYAAPVSRRSAGAIRPTITPPASILATSPVYKEFLDIEFQAGALPEGVGIRLATKHQFTWVFATDAGTPIVAVGYWT